jgi:aspartyl-tRNA(Asn)/glutamyl-tRNA(Gln) amidotransferase subunit B
MPFADFEIVVGLEVHVQLLTTTKLFCADTTVFGTEPNSQVSTISLAHPGTLPRLNREALQMAVKLGLALNSSISSSTWFARKHYFYPDLPKGYQVSQQTTPVCIGGYIEVPAGKEVRRIRLHHIHMEEDAGKSIHGADTPYSNIDCNRAGTALLEIVTEPDIRSAEEAFYFVSYLRKLVRQLRICDGNMEEGSLRCDVNISVRRKGETKLGTKNEIKNLNSIRFIRNAIETEAERLVQMVEKGEPILQQTRGYDEATGTTYPIRTKEDEDDYRYFPEPDLPPFSITNETIERIRQTLPPSEASVKAALQQSFNLSDYDAGQLASDPALTVYFKSLVEQGIAAKTAANWTHGVVRNTAMQHELNTEDIPVPPPLLATLIRLVEDRQINYGTATGQVWPVLWNEPEVDIFRFVQEHQLLQQSNAGELETLIEAALQKHSGKITEYKKGKKGLLSLFVGEVMKLSKGKADAKLVTDIITQKLK